MQVQTYPEHSSSYPLLLTTFMKRPVRLYPNEIGVVYRNPHSGRYFRFTWAQWYERTCKLANALGTLGVQPGKPGAPGDRVATLALTHHYHLELYYAASCSGAVLHPINMRLSHDHIIHTINHAEDKVLFFDDIFLPLVEAIYDQIKDTVQTFVCISDDPDKPDSKIENLLTYEDLIGGESADYEWPVLDENTKATICYTTGTTGLPKGVMFSHRALYLMVLHSAYATSINTDPLAVHLGENAVVLFNVPLFHIHAWGMPYSCVFAANKIVLPGMFTTDGFCELVQTEKVTSSALVPTILAMIIEYPELKSYDLSSLKSIGVGGAALPLGLKKKAEQTIPGFRATGGYGMTETGPITVSAFMKKTISKLPLEEREKLQIKTGLPIPGLEVIVVGEDGKSVPQDNETIGEIVMRGPWIMEEYYNEAEKTAEVWRDGWFHTGDVAKVDEEGYITIADRMSDMIRSGAEMVPTVLLENLVSTADFVLEATVLGVPDRIWGERPMCLATLRPDATQTEEDILAYLQTEGVDKGKITKWMLPDFIVITDDIPKTSVGKFNKRAIKNDLDAFLGKAKDMRPAETSE